MSVHYPYKTMGQISFYHTLTVQVKTVLPPNYFILHFVVKSETEYTELLQPLLYLLYTADLPTSTESTTAAFANILQY
jgi:hypothetical protein